MTSVLLVLVKFYPHPFLFPPLLLGIPQHQREENSCSPIAFGLKTRLAREEFIFEIDICYLQLWNLNSLGIKSTASVYISGEVPRFF